MKNAFNYLKHLWSEKLVFGLYEQIEDFFQKTVSSVGQKTVEFLANNYLFICLFCTFLWFFYAFYPGAIALDTFSIYASAVYNSIGTWDSALLIRFWQFILFFTDIRGIFVFIQLAAIFVGLYIIGKNISKGILTGIICSLVLFIPSVFADIVVVLKDTYLAAFIFLVSALLFDNVLSGKNKTFLFYAFCATLLIVCFYIRSNGCFIAVPLIVALFMGWKAPIIFRYTICLVLVLCVLVTTSFVEKKLLKAHDEAPDFSLMLFDIIGTAKSSGQSTLPDIPEVPDQMALINHCYTSLQWDTIAYWEERDNCNAIAMHYFVNKNKNVEVNKNNDVKNLKQARSILRKAWFAAITQYPFAYLKHRILHFNRFIDYQGHEPVFRPLYIGEFVGYIGFQGKDEPLTYYKEGPQIWKKFLRNDLANQLWFHPYVSLLVLLFFYLSTLTTSDQFNRTLNVVSFSGLIYLVGFLFVGVSSDFRYSYPSLLLSILCILAAFSFYSQKREIFGTRKTRIVATLVTVPLFLIGIIL